MPNRQFYTYKFNSGFLKEYKYNVTLTFEEAEENKQIIEVADNQFLRTIRRVTKHTVSKDKVELLYSVRKVLDKKISCSPRVEELREMRENIQQKINRTMFIPQYVTVVMEHNAHYKAMYENGFKINNVLYKRFSCSAGQARVSTVVFCPSDLMPQLKIILDNNRNKLVKVAPNKYNAYFGLYGSATQVVSEPKFVVVKDFENIATFKCNWVTETDWDKDDEVEQRTVIMPMNRTDGMGLISPRQAKKWADELGLDYIPAQFGLRQSFMKGMLCTFDIHDFCQQINGGSYIIETAYSNEDGTPIKADLREYDVIISTSQFKFWDSYNSIEEYIQSCRQNHLEWGVPQVAPKQCKDILKMNYQFLQTLNIADEDIPLICQQFVDWVQGVSYSDTAYMLLFLLGINNDEDNIRRIINSDRDYWLKGLMLNPQLMRNDKYIRSRIKNLIKKKMQDGCMGEIYLDGNFQTLVSDPYAFMQHVCGVPVTGLLKENEYYSNYWNEKHISKVDGMRSPLTFRSEHVLMDLIKTDQTEKWYKYCKTGIILNWFGHDCVNFAGSDFDLDILATTSNEVVLRSTYTDELPVCYEVPKPQKKICTEEDLFNADLFSFGSIIGGITNKSSNAYAVLVDLQNKPNTEKQQKLVHSRLIQCCKAQGKQIDKAKIGMQVKGIPDVWIKYQKLNIDKETGVINDTPDEIENKQILNDCLLDKPPYFFRYRYDDYNKKYKNYVDKFNITCQQRFRCKLSDLQTKEVLTTDESEFLQDYKRYFPLVDNNSTMNKICHYIESMNKDTRERVKKDITDEVVLYLRDNKCNSANTYTRNSIIVFFSDFIKNEGINRSNTADENSKIINYRLKKIERELLKIESDIRVVVNVLLDTYYLNGKYQSIIWEVFGNTLLKNLKENSGMPYMYPLRNEDGNKEYLGKKYRWEIIER